MPTTIEEEEEDNAMDNTGFLDDLDDYYDEEQVQALAGENSSFAGFLPLASDTAIENNIKLLSDALEGHMTQHLESTVSTPAFDSSQMNGALDDNQQLSMQTTTVPDALSDNGVGRNPSMEHFADKLNQWRPKAVNDTLFVDLLLKQVDPQCKCLLSLRIHDTDIILDIVNDTYLKENASDLLGKLTQNSTQASQALYYLSSLEDVDCGPTLTSLDNVSDHERIKIMVYHMLDQGSYKASGYMEFTNVCFCMLIAAYRMPWSISRMPRGWVMLCNTRSSRLWRSIATLPTLYKPRELPKGR